MWSLLTLNFQNLWTCQILLKVSKVIHQPIFNLFSKNCPIVQIAKSRSKAYPCILILFVWCNSKRFEACLTSWTNAKHFYFDIKKYVLGTRLAMYWNFIFQTLNIVIIQKIKFLKMCIKVQKAQTLI
jgi:hypothetical protein